MLISHPGKVILKIILNRLPPHAEEIIAEAHTGIRAGRSTTEQIVNLRIFREKYPQHQQSLYHLFIVSRKHLTEALRATLRKYNINASSIRESYESLKIYMTSPECSPVQWQHRGLVQNYSASHKRNLLSLTSSKRESCVRYVIVSNNMKLLSAWEDGTLITTALQMASL